MKTFGVLLAIVIGTCIAGIAGCSIWAAMQDKKSAELRQYWEKAGQAAVASKMDYPTFLKRVKVHTGYAAPVLGRGYNELTGYEERYVEDRDTFSGGIFGPVRVGIHVNLDRGGRIVGYKVQEMGAAL